MENAGEYKVGDEQTVAAFADVKKVDVTGTSKGKGFAGVMKRYGFAGGPGGHGAHFHRAPGSVGQCATPSRVFKNKHMGGHYGVDRVTVQNLEVVSVDAERDLLLVKGAVPGASEVECGNYRDMDLPAAKAEAAAMLPVLEALTAEDLHY